MLIQVRDVGPLRSSAYAAVTRVPERKRGVRREEGGGVRPPGGSPVVVVRTEGPPFPRRDRRTGGLGVLRDDSSSGLPAPAPLPRRVGPGEDGHLPRKRLITTEPIATLCPRI